MKEKFISLVVILFIIVFYSFLFYALSFAPFLGVSLNSYLDSLLFNMATLSTTCLFLFGFYYLYDRISFLQRKMVKYITGFVFSFGTLLVFDTLLSGVSIHIVTLFIFSMALALTYQDDPDSFRSLKRTITKKDL